MPCSITKNNEEIFLSSLGVFESLYNEIKDIVDQESVATNKEFDRFMKELDETIFTWGGMSPDIQEIFTESRNLELLIVLLERVIYILRSQVRSDVLQALWKFHAELIKYKEELEAQGR